MLKDKIASLSAAYDRKKDTLDRVRIFFKLVLIGAFVISFPHLILKDYFDLKNPNKNNLLSAKEKYATFTWLKNNSLPDDIVLSEWTEGNDVVAVANRRVVVSSKVYPSEAQEVASRYTDLSRFFFSTSQAEAGEILKKYQVDWIFLNKSFDNFLCNYTGRCSWQGTLLSDILSDKKTDFIQRVYESKNTLIYKVSNEADKNKNELVHLSAGDFDEKLIRLGFESANKTNIEKVEIAGLIVPHHYPYVNYLLADLFNRVKPPKEVIILGPEHNPGGAAVKTALGIWETPFGSLSSGEKTLDLISNKDNVLVDNEAHLNEWSVSTLFPYVKYAFPDAAVVPILVSDNISSQQIQKLSDKLSVGVEKDTLVILSSDFVHQTSQEEADKADEESIQEITALKKDKIDSLVLDARGGLKLFLEIMGKAGIKSGELVKHSNDYQETEKYPEFETYPYLVTYQTWLFKK